MAEEIGVLRVDLTLDNTDFQKSTQQIDSKLRALNSEFKASSAGVEGYEKTLEGLRAKQDKLTNQMDLQKVKISALKKEYDQIVEAQGANSVAADKMLTKYNNAVAALKKTENQLDKTTRAIKEQENPWKQVGIAAEDYQSVMEKLDKKLSNFSQKTKDLGGKLSAGVTLPLVGLGVAAGKTAIEFDSAQKRMQASLGITSEEAEKLTGVAQEVWKKGFGENITQVATDLALLKQQFGDLNDKELSALLESSYTLSDLFGADITESARTASVMMKTFGIESQEAMDLITFAFQKGGNFSDELLDTLREYSPQFKALGYDAEAFTAILIQGAETGAFNLDKLGDAAKESFLRIGDGSKSSREALEDLGLDFKQIEKDISSGGETANSAFAAVASAIALVEDPAEKSRLAIALMGTPIEDLGPEFQNFFANVKTDLEGFEGAAQKAGETLQESFGERWESTTRKAQEALLPLGETLLDIAEKWLPKIDDAIEDLTNRFNELSPKAQDATLAIGGVAAVAGPVLAGIGFAAQGIGALIKIGTPLIKFLTGAGKAGGKAATGIGSVGSVLGPATLGLGLFTGASAALSSKWDELVEKSPSFLVALGASSPQMVLMAGAMDTLRDHTGLTLESINLFGEGVSESTQKAVGGFLDLEYQATTSLNQLAWSGQEVTTQMATNLIAIYDEMGNQVLTAMQEDHTAQLQLMTDHFAQSSALTEQEETEILANMQTKQSERETLISEGQARIAEILNTASAEKRSITQAEQQEINQIQQTMTENAVTYLTENEREQKVILENLKNEASKITAQQAAEVVKNSKAQKEEVVKEAKEQYDQTVAEIIKQRDEMGTISVEQADKLIEEAKRQRDDTIKNAEEMHTSVVEEAQKQADEHVGLVNWETGEVLSKWEQFKAELSKKAAEIVVDLSKKWTEISKDTVDKWEQIKSWPGKKIEEMKTDVSTKMDSVKNVISNKLDEIKSFFTNLELKLPEIQLPKLPTIELETKTKTVLGKKFTYPSGFDVIWHAEGGIMDGPTIFGAMGNKLLGGGEAGPEAILPLNNRVLGEIGDAIAETMDLESLNSNLTRFVASTTGSFGNSSSTTTYGDIYVTVPVNELKEIRSVVDLFNRLPQASRAR